MFFGALKTVSPTAAQRLQPTGARPRGSRYNLAFLESGEWLTTMGFRQAPVAARVADGRKPKTAHFPREPLSECKNLGGTS